jgi:hypothetical protein
MWDRWQEGDSMHAIARLIDQGQDYGSQMVEQIVKMALRYGVEKLHLQTDAMDGGLYARLGWTPYTLVTNRGLDVLVMERQLSS